MHQKGYIFELGDLIHDHQGTKVIFDLDEKNTLELDERIKPLSNITCKVSLMKLEDGIFVEIRDLSLKLEFECAKCKTEFSQEIKIDHTDRVFYFEKQKETQDLMDIFYVTMKNMEIDISDLLRQEIILHFPMIPVCSKSCKGLCPNCGANKNVKNCSCSIKPAEQKPLEILKKLYHV